MPVHLLLFMFVFVSNAVAQSFSVDERRPMAAILDKLELEFGVPIHYEDPRFVPDRDTEDVSNQNLSMRILLPSRVKLTVPRLYSSFPSASEKTKQIQAAIDAYPSTGLPHEFMLDREGPYYFVGPRQKTQAMMSVVVSIPLTAKHLPEAIASLMDAVSKATGVKAVFWNPQLVPYHLVDLEADREPAGKVLVRILNQLGPSNALSYRMRYDPAARYYMLNIQARGGSAIETAPPPFSGPRRL